MISSKQQRKLEMVAIAGCAVGLVSLGIVTLMFGDWLGPWQPAPKEWRSPGAYISGAILLVAGLGFASPLHRRRAAAIGAAWIGVWILVLHVPLVIMNVGNLAYYLGPAETLVMALGLTLIALQSMSFSGRRAVEIACGMAMLIFGASHFVYSGLTADMVPDWIPQPLLVTYLTGAIHALAGAFLVAGKFVRAAAAAEAAMLTCIVALLHLPEAILNPSQGKLMITAAPILLASAVWVICATAYRSDEERSGAIPQSAESLA